MIAKVILRLLAENEWDQLRLASESGVDQTTISAILTRRTKSPKIDTLQKIATAFGKDLSIFQVESEKPNPTPDERERKAQHFFRATHIAEEDKQTILKFIELYEEKAKRAREKGGKDGEEDSSPDI